HTPRRGKEAHQPPAESECIPVAVVEENILTLQLFRTPSYFLEVWKELLKHSTRLSLFWRRLRSEERRVGKEGRIWWRRARATEGKAVRLREVNRGDTRRTS